MPLQIDRAPLVWSPTTLMIASRCIRSLYYYRKRIDVPITQDIALGIFLHSKLANFYKEDGTPKFKSPESYESRLEGDWKRYPARTGKISGARIQYEGNELYMLLPKIRGIAHKVYEEYSQQPPPLLVEYPKIDRRRTHNTVLQLESKVDGRPIIKVLTGRIDEIRPGLTIRDHKYIRRKKFEEMTLSYDLQFTIYTLYLAGLILNSKKLEEFLKVKEFLGVNELPDIISLAQQINLEYHIMRAEYEYEKKDKEITKKLAVDVKVVPAKKRTEQQFHETIEIMDDLERRISEAPFHPTRGDYCDRCLYRNPCDQDSANVVVQLECIQPKLFTELEVKPTKVENLKIPFPRIRRKRSKLKAEKV